ncbi:restin homolog [Plectropomus leopardus]|uniref:restin homolog n=1 Tax=Plectropomus leopardus TaxID=160734 RepID=UPI001C4A78F8|nr:restin homolog [Plectropomus leopardus]
MIQDRQKVDTELCELREALKDAETRAKTCEEERNQAIQKCQTTTETQKTLLNQIEEMNQRLRLTRENHSEVQEQLREANNKISQACLEKAILSTQVLKLEDNAKELKAKLTSALSDKNHLIQQKADLHQRAQQGSDGCDVPVIQADTKSHNNKQAELIKEEVKALREVNEKLTGELQMIQEKLKTSQSQLQEVTAERATDSKQITDLQAERSQLIRDKEELLRRMNEAGNEQLIETKEKCCKLRESVEVLELEKQKLQDRCLCLEAEVLEKEEKLQLREEEHLKQDSTRVQRIEELKAVASHWAEKWEKVALTLHLTKEELEGLKKSNSRNETESGSLLRVELDACKQELELERSRGGKTLVHTEDTETQTDLSESSLLWEPPSDAHSSQNKAPQVCIQSSEVQRLKQKLSLREKELREKEEALTSLERLRETENTLAQLKIAALELKVKDEKPSAEGRKDKTVCPVLLETEQQRRMVTEQLKSLFKGREGKDIGKADSRSAAGQTGASSLQDWSQTSKAVRGAVDRRSWQQHSSGLMPVFEEDEEGVDLPGEEEGGSAEEAHTEGNVHNQSQQMSTMRAEVCNLKAKNENLLQATLRCKQPTQDKSHHCSDEVDLPLTRPLSLYPDGIFLAEFVDICSPDEDEEEGEDE